MLLGGPQHAHWDQGGPPEQWEPDNQEYENPQGHDAQADTRETTQDEWDLLWEFEEARELPRDQMGDRSVDETPHPPPAPPSIQGVHPGVTPEDTQQWDMYTGARGHKLAGQGDVASN
ncbi:hypothetical protein CYMTET_49985 [Cymbomonas tetramitiformis]|uniref:Uncharacterized protein n=1 Tax=Cymbomonas tetramitiformis TaxID=36881 RepID=A0AAE0BQ93_9CHLO|nr:hypothetical protein CYMTET_49985 [Cymbomonas tetramitiformis]